MASANTAIYSQLYLLSRKQVIFFPRFYEQKTKKLMDFVALRLHILYILVSLSKEKTKCS